MNPVEFWIGQKSGNLASLSAGAKIGSLRWASDGGCLLRRLRAGVVVSSSIAAPGPIDISLKMARGFTTDFSTNSTAVDMRLGSGRMSGRARPSRLGSAGPRIATTAGMGGDTIAKLDDDPLGIHCFSLPAFTNGIGSGMVTLFDGNLAIEKDEGLIVSAVSGGFASGAYNLFLEWCWWEEMQ